MNAFASNRPCAKFRVVPLKSRQKPKEKSVPCIKLLKALADDTRWNLVQELMRKPSTVNELTTHLSVTQYNASKHLRILREAGIIESTREGKNIRYSVVPSFHRRISNHKTTLDLGCCKFDF